MRKTGLAVWDGDGVAWEGCLMSDMHEQICVANGWTDYTLKDRAHPTKEDIKAFIGAITGRSIKHFRPFTDRLTADAWQLLTPWTREQLQAQADAGYHIILLSESPDFAIRALARGLPLLHHARGTWLHRHGREFTGLGFALPKGPYLTSYLTDNGLSNLRIQFAADDTKRTFLDQAEQPVAVNPVPELEQHALQNGWQIVRTIGPLATGRVAEVADTLRA